MVGWTVSVEITSEFFRAGRVAHLSESLGFNLSYTLSGIKLFADFFQVVGIQPDKRIRITLDSRSVRLSRMDSVAPVRPDGSGTSGARMFYPR